jgi:hypothetical protein
MKHVALFVLALALVAGCTSSKQSDNPFVGVWRPLEMEAGLPDACYNVRVEFRADNRMVVQSGPQILTASYTVEADGNGFSMLQTDLETNGEPNCQGLSAEFVLANYILEAYVEVDGEVLRFFAGGKDQNQFVSLVRAEPSSE